MTITIKYYLDFMIITNHIIMIIKSVKHQDDDFKYFITILKLNFNFKLVITKIINLDVIIFIITNQLHYVVNIIKMDDLYINQNNYYQVAIISIMNFMFVLDFINIVVVIIMNDANIKVELATRDFIVIKN